MCIRDSVGCIGYTSPIKISQIQSMLPSGWFSIMTTGYDLTYDRLFRIAYYYVKREEWAQEIVLDVFMRLWDQRKKLPEIGRAHV